MQKEVQFFNRKTAIKGHQIKGKCMPLLANLLRCIYRDFFFLIAFSLFFLNKINGQNNLLENQSITINSIKQQLKTSIGQKRLVLLGEPTHGEGNVFEIKTKICQFLHDSLGFNIIAFESSLYDMHETDEVIKSHPDLCAKPFAANAIFNIWSSSKEFQHFLNWYDQNKSSITLLGFDPQFSADANTMELTDCIADYLKLQDAKYAFPEDLLYKALAAFREEFSFPDDLKYVDFLTSSSSIIEELKKILAFNHLNKEQQNKGQWYLQFMQNVLMLGKDYYAKRNMNLNARNFKAYYSNPRDSMMAQNLLWLLKKYPDQKIICWGAAEHLIKSTNTIQNNELNQFKPMGSYLTKALGDSSLFSLTFISPAGNYGSISEETRQVPVPVPESIEGFTATGKSIQFLDLHKPKYNQQLISYSIEYTPIKANWSSCFDAFICLNKFKRSHFLSKEYLPQNWPVQFVDTSTNEKSIEQSTPQKKIQTNSAHLQHALPYHYAGRILDAQSHQPIAYSTIRFITNGNVIMADAKGNFNSDQVFDSSQIIISAIGYQPKLIQVHSEKDLNIHMQPLQNDLVDVIVKSKSIHTMSIVDSIKQHLKLNYGNAPFLQPAYEKRQITNYDSTIFDQDLILEVNRFKGLGNATITYTHQKVNKFNDQIMTSIGMPYNFGPDWTKDLDFIRSGFIFSSNLTRGYVFNLKRTYFDNSKGFIYVLGFKAKRLSGKYTNGTFVASMAGEIKVRKQDYAVLSIQYVTSRNISKLQKWTEKYYNNNNEHGIWNRMPEKEAGIVNIQYKMDSSLHKYIVHHSSSQWFEQGYFMKDHHHFKLDFKFTFQDLHQTKVISSLNKREKKNHRYPYQLPPKDAFWENFIFPDK